MDNLGGVPGELLTITQPQQADLTRWQETTEDIIQEIENDLRCLAYDPDAKKYFRPPGTHPRVNEQGILEIIGILRHLLHKITFLSNLTELDIIDKVFDVNVDILEKLTYHAEDWGVKEVDVRPIANMVVNLTDIGLKKALNEGERLAITNAQKRIERTISMPGMEGPGLMGRLKGAFRG